MKLHTARCATVAIAASLALGPTFVAAQTAATDGSATQPTVVLPDAQTPAMVSPVAPPQPTVQPEPVIALPDTGTPETVTPETVTPETVVPEPAVEDAEPVAARSSAPAAAPAMVRASPQSQPVVADDTAVSTGSSTTAFPATPTEPVAAAEAAPAAGEIAPVTSGQFAADDAAGNVISLIALALVGLIPIGLGIMALVWWRRRSKAVPSAAMNSAIVERNEEPQRANASVPLATGRRANIDARGTSSSMLFDRPVRVPDDTGFATRSTAATSAQAPRNQSSLSGAGKGAVVLPSSVPQDFAERDALLHRLIEAEPDRANPFHAPRARAKRAKLIIQSIGRRFERAAPRFDLSQYSYIWPHLAKGRTATVAA